MNKEIIILLDFLKSKNIKENTCSKTEFMKFVIEEKQVSIQTLKNYIYILKLINVISYEKNLITINKKKLDEIIVEDLKKQELV
jgi:hypothetical protein